MKSWAVMVSWMVVVIAGVPSCRLVVGGPLSRWVNPSVKCWRLARDGLTPAYFAVASGAPVNLIQRMLGHESAAMTLDVYADLFESQLGTVSAGNSSRAGAQW